MKYLMTLTLCLSMGWTANASHLFKTGTKVALAMTGGWAEATVTGLTYNRKKGNVPTYKVLFTMPTQVPVQDYKFNKYWRNKHVEEYAEVDHLRPLAQPVPGTRIIITRGQHRGKHGTIKKYPRKKQPAAGNVACKLDNGYKLLTPHYMRNGAARCGQYIRFNFEFVPGKWASYVCKIGRSREENDNQSEVTYVAGNWPNQWGDANSRMMTVEQQPNQMFTFENEQGSRVFTDQKGHRFRFEYTDAPTWILENDKLKNVLKKDVLAMENAALKKQNADLKKQNADLEEQNELLKEDNDEWELMYDNLKDKMLKKAMPGNDL